ncbi:MAG: hypothetical protein JKY95_05180 [Planctomycetaceae bacterium]|nr:hypothetical protein [Planctomycetaceae bacterium]
MIKKKDSKRLYSLDAYRGLVMIVLASSGLGITAASKMPGGEFLQEYVFYVTHPEWISNFLTFGVSPWDMIQPAFMFMVGVSMPYSYSKRKARGDSYISRFSHAWSRAIMLVLLGVFLRSNGADQTNWTFLDVVSQIGLGYGFLFFLIGRKFITLAIVAALVLGLTIGAFIQYSPGANPWAFNENVFSVLDVWFLNLLPRSVPFEGNGGGYTTFNFIPAFVTMLFGVMCGELLNKEETSSWQKILRLTIGAAVCLGLGLGLSESGYCPIIKKIWSPSWTLFSGAYVIAALMVFYLVLDVIRFRFWAYPLIVVGLNPLTIYCMGHLIKGWSIKLFHTHLPAAWFEGWQGQINQSALVLLLFWLILFWMHRKRFYIRL